MKAHGPPPSCPWLTAPFTRLMALDTTALRKLLCDRLCKDVGIDVRQLDGALMLRSHFQFPDGDSYPIYLDQTPGGELQLSDSGHTLMHISYNHDVDSILNGKRRSLLEQVTRESGLHWDRERGVFWLNTAPERLPEALFTFGQGLTRIYDLTLLSHSNVRSTFSEDLDRLLFSQVEAEKITKNYQPDVPNKQNYPVDYHIAGKGEKPLFLYGVANQSKAQLVTINLSHFHRHHLQFESMIIFEDQSKLSKPVVARLSDVGGDMISSLSAEADIQRKLAQRLG